MDTVQDEMANSSQEVNQAGPSCAGAGASSLQQKYNELDSIFEGPSNATQGAIGDSILVPETEGGTDMEATIDYWLQRLSRAERRKAQLDEKEKSLREVHDKQAQMILHSQMEVEQISSKLENLMKNREVIEAKVQHTCEIGQALKQYSEQIKASICEIYGVKDNMSKEADELLESFANITQDEKLMEQLEEVRRLQCAIAEQNQKRANWEKEFKAKKEFERTRHEKRMAEILRETNEIQRTVEGKKVELAAAQERRAAIQQRVHNLSKENKEITELKNSVSNLKDKISKSIETRLNPVLEENLRLSAQSDNLSEEISAATGRIQALEEDKIKTENEWKVLSENLVEAETKESDLLDKLNNMRLKNLEVESQLESLRKELEDKECTGQKDVSDLESKLSNTKEMTSARSGKILQEINATKENCALISERCNEKKDALSVMTSQYEDLLKLKEIAKEQEECLNSQVKTMEEEKQRLSIISQKLMTEINIEEKNQMKLTESLDSQQQSAEEKENAIRNEIKSIQDETTKIKETIAARRASNELLRKKLKEVQCGSLISKEQVHDKFSSIIDEKRNRIELLNKQLEEAWNADQSRATELKEQFEKLKEKLKARETLISETAKSCNTVIEETESLKDVQRKMQHDIDVMKTTEEELIEKRRVSEQNLEHQMTQKDELALHLQEAEEILKSKNIRKSELEQKIASLEKHNADSAVQNCEEIKEIMHNILKDKQTCETLISTTSEMNNEISDIMSKCDTAQREKESKQKILARLDSETQTCNEENDKLSFELDQILKENDSLEKKIASLKRETQSSNQMYDTMVKGVAAAKAKKAQQESYLATTQKSPARERESSGSNRLNAEEDTNPLSHSDKEESQEGR